MRGRPPLPQTLKLLRGTAKPCRANPAEPSVPNLTADAKPPSWLNRQAKAVWRETLPGVCSWVTIADGDLLGRWCALINEWRILRRDLDTHGMTQTRISATGVVLGSMKRPEVEMIRQVEKSLTTVESSLGFSPSSRSRVKATVSEIRDTLDEELFG